MASKYELSKTYQYRKVMKPLLERKRRARINKCLDDLKDLMAECLQQQSGDPNAKLEKVDILELTVQHLRKLKCQRNAGAGAGAAASERGADKSSFRSGYIQAANEVSRCLAAQPNVDVQLGTTLMTHLGVRLNQLEAAQQTTTAIHAPLSINCYNAPSARAPTDRQRSAHAPAMYSPVSSGYASDSESAYATSASASPVSSVSRSQQNSPAAYQTQSTAGLLQVAAAPVWRPW